MSILEKIVMAWVLAMAILIVVAWQAKPRSVDRILADRIEELEKRCDSEYARGMSDASIAFRNGMAYALTNSVQSAFEKEVSP